MGGLPRFLALWKRTLKVIVLGVILIKVNIYKDYWLEIIRNNVFM